MDPSGDTLILIHSSRRDVRAAATFRVDSRVLFDAGCKVLTDELQDTTSPQCWYDSEASNDGHHAQRGSSAGGSGQATSSHTSPDSDMPITPSSKTGWDPKFSARARYKIKLNYPGDQIGLDATSWLLTTRNFLAVLYGADSLCGTSLFEALKTLSARIREQPGWLHASANKTAFIADFLRRHRFDDVRSSPSNAASILAFSELGSIRWKAGYTEAFVHCVGMFNAGLSDVPEWKVIPPRSRIFIENAALEAEPRLRRAQNLLGDFSFPDLWPAKTPLKYPARAAFERLRRWLCSYCSARESSGTWPPAPNAQGIWLTRERLVMLRDLFSSLFDYLVDHDIIFDSLECSSGERSWVIVSRSGQFFRPDVPDVPVTDMLTRFDDTHGFAHLPSPYPLLPEAVAATTDASSSHSKSSSNSSGSSHIFTIPIASNAAPAAASPAATLSAEALLQRKALAYVDASNLYTTTALSPAIADFNAFERTDRLAAVDPRPARLGRWLLVYAALQALAPVAVDTPGLRYAERVPHYHLNASLRGVVPWRGDGADGGDAWDPTSPPEPHPRQFHPFTAPAAWPRAAPRARPGAHRPIVGGAVGDGRARADANTGLQRQRPTNPSPPLPPLPAEARAASVEPALASPRAPRSPHWPLAARGGDGGGARSGGLLLGSLRRESSGQGLLRREGGRGGLAGIAVAAAAAATTTASAPARPEADEAEVPTARDRVERARQRERAEKERQRAERERARADKERERVRKRRAEIHGFSDYRPPEGW